MDALRAKKRELAVLQEQAEVRSFHIHQENAPFSFHSYIHRLSMHG